MGWIWGVGSGFALNLVEISCGEDKTVWECTGTLPHAN